MIVLITRRDYNYAMDSALTMKRSYDSMKEATEGMSEVLAAFDGEIKWQRRFEGEITLRELNSYYEELQKSKVLLIEEDKNILDVQGSPKSAFEKYSKLADELAKKIKETGVGKPPVRQEDFSTLTTRNLETEDNLFDPSTTSSESTSPNEELITTSGHSSTLEVSKVTFVVREFTAGETTTPLRTEVGVTTEGRVVDYKTSTVTASPTRSVGIGKR